MAETSLDPIEQILSRSTEQLIEQIAKNAQSLYRVEWRDLERIMAKVYEELGFQAELTNAAQNGGKDVAYCYAFWTDR